MHIDPINGGPVELFLVPASVVTKAVVPIILCDGAYKRSCANKNE